MTGKVFYEWVIEQVDEYGDIQDVSHYDTFAQAMTARDRRLAIGEYDCVEIACIRVVCDGDSRGYAYVNLDNMTIDSHYCCGSKVPKHIIKQVA